MDKKSHKSTAFFSIEAKTQLPLRRLSWICNFLLLMLIQFQNVPLQPQQQDQFKKKKKKLRKKIITVFSKFFSTKKTKREKLGNSHLLKETERKMLSCTTQWPRQLLVLKNESRPSEMCLHGPLCLTVISIDLTLSPALISCGLELPSSLLYRKTASVSLAGETGG